MTDLPHLYKLKSEGSVAGNLTTRCENLPDIIVAPPIQFGGPGDAWSPEDLLMASIANCLVLSFRAIAKASKFEWIAIECDAEGKLDKVERKIKFTSVMSKVKLVIPSTESKEKAEKLLNKAEETCFITNSMACESGIECEIIFSDE